MANPETKLLYSASKLLTTFFDIKWSARTKYLSVNNGMQLANAPNQQSYDNRLFTGAFKIASVRCVRPYDEMKLFNFPASACSNFTVRNRARPVASHRYMLPIVSPVIRQCTVANQSLTTQFFCQHSYAIC
jgi:hypothetical protein